MWHHEDAGIGFNVFRASALANATTAMVPVTGHYNDPGVIERTPYAACNGRVTGVCRASSSGRRTTRRDPDPSIRGIRSPHFQMASRPV